MSDESGQEPLPAEWARVYRESMNAGSPGCPGADMLACLVLGETEGEERLALADHVVACRHCAELARDGMHLKEEAGRLAGLVDESSRPVIRRRSSLIGAAAAAVFLACVGLSVYFWNETGMPTDSVPSERGPEQSALQGEPLDGAVLAAAPDLLDWPPEARTQVYWVALYDVESTPIWQSARGPATSLRLPQDVKARLRFGQIYYWRVFFLVGLETRQTSLRSFSLSP